jgi:hypothetical protein
MVKANWWRPLPALALLGVAAALSATAGTPNELPEAALGWSLLLHLERAVVLVAGLGLVVLVGTRATMGQFPFRLGCGARRRPDYWGSRYDGLIMSDGSRANGKRPLLISASARKALDEYRVYYRTRLPKLRAQAARADANIRWIAEGHYKDPRARPPFD